TTVRVSDRRRNDRVFILTVAATVRLIVVTLAIPSALRGGSSFHIGTFGRFSFCKDALRRCSAAIFRSNNRRNQDLLRFWRANSAFRIAQSLNKPWLL